MNSTGSTITPRARLVAWIAGTVLSNSSVGRQSASCTPWWAHHCGHSSGRERAATRGRRATSRVAHAGAG